MRTVLIVALLVVLMVVGGWIAFSYTGGTAKVELKTDAVQRDVENAIQGTKDFIKGVGDEKQSTTPPEVLEPVKP